MGLKGGRKGSTEQKERIGEEEIRKKGGRKRSTII
jgi:hypothetical protein